MGYVAKQECEQQMFRLIEQCHSCDMTKKEFRKEQIIPDHKANRLQELLSPNWKPLPENHQ